MIKRQTLTNEERYITSEIKNKENRIFQIKSRVSSREYEIFCELRNIVAEKKKQIRSIAKSIASLDALLGLSIASVENNLKPSLIPINDSLTKTIQQLLQEETQSLNNY